MDENLCRICGDGDGDGEPLFHPCKCTGSIRHIHEVCLVKWLSIRSTGRSDSSNSFSFDTLEGVKCELCGHSFQFSPEYSSDYSTHGGLGFSLRLSLEIIRSLIATAVRRSMPVLTLVGWVVVFPITMGFFLLLSLSLLFRTNLNLYGQSVLSARASGVRIYFVGSMVAMVGSVALDRVLRARRALRERSWRMYILMGLIGLAASLTLLTVPYFTGRAVLGLILHECMRFSIESTVCLSLGRNHGPLTDFNHDVSLVTIGSVAWFLVGTLATMSYRMYTAGFSVIVQSVAEFFRKSSRSVSSFFVPLLVGHLMTPLLPDWIVLWISEQTQGAQILLTIATGCAITTPTVFVQKYFFEIFFSPLSNTPLLRLLLRGRSASEPISASGILIRAVVQLCVLYGAVKPVWGFLTASSILPVDVSVSSGIGSPLVLPFELFYAHILVPLLLNTPRVPDHFRRWWTRIERARDLYLLGANSMLIALVGLVTLVLASSVALLILVGLPISLGRLIVGKGDDVVAYPLGLLIALLTVHLVVRLIPGGRLRARSTATSSLRTKFWISLASLLLTVVSVGIVLPVVVGVSFQLGAVLALRRLSFALPVASPEPVTWWTQTLPVWIIGVMLIKICGALAGVGAVPRWRSTLDRIKHLSETEGWASRSVQDLIRKSVVIPVVVWCVKACITPYVIGVVVEKTTGLRISELAVLAFWLLTLGLRYIAPWLATALARQKEMALKRRYLVRTKLCNFAPAVAGVHELVGVIHRSPNP